jgi:recombinational DNA repair protein RecR
MAYTPELSRKDSGALRRIAWALHVPMTKAMAKVFEQVARTADDSKICNCCKDKSFCYLCHFSKESQEEVQNQLCDDQDIWRIH